MVTEIGKKCISLKQCSNKVSMLQFSMQLHFTSAKNTQEIKQDKMCKLVFQLQRVVSYFHGETMIRP